MFMYNLMCGSVTCIMGVALSGFGDDVTGSWKKLNTELTRYIALRILYKRLNLLFSFVNYDII